MQREAYLDDLRKDLIPDKLFLTDSTNELNLEISTNHWKISISNELAEEISIEDFLILLDAIKQNRQQQLNSSPLEIDLIYYLWYDDQAGQLRFNFINSNHKALPFACPLEVVDTSREIVSDFLSSGYVAGFSLEELTSELDSSDDEIPPFILKVYSEKLMKQR